MNRLADAENAGLTGFPETRLEYLELVKCFESQGEDYEEARNDKRRWLAAGKGDFDKVHAIRTHEIAKKMKDAAELSEKK